MSKFLWSRSSSTLRLRITKAGLPEDTQIQRIRHARGFLGSNRDYLLKTRLHLRSLGICDDYIERLASGTEQD